MASDISALSHIEKVIQLLYIEESPEYLIAMETLLHEVFGSQVTLVNVRTIQEAKRVLYQTRFDATILSLSHCPTNELENLHKLLASFPFQAVVIILDGAKVELGMKAIQSGAQDFLIQGEIAHNAILRVIRYAVERSKTATRFMQLAHKDNLTGLPNRAGFMEHIESSLSQANRRQSTIALLFIDLDNFKTINDTLGHDVGDEFLKSVSQLFHAQIRKSDFLARLGGDEFTIILQCAKPGMDEPLAVAQKLIKAMNSAVNLADGQCINGSCSIGVALFEGGIAKDEPVANVSAKSLIQRADIAMYHAKSKTGSSVCFFDERLEAEASDHLDLARELKQAWENKELQLFYQPIVEASEDRVAAVDLFIRWTSEKRGLLDLSGLIHQFADKSLIHGLSRWSLEESCHQFKKWMDDRRIPDNGWLSYNVSPSYFLHPEFVSDLSFILRTSELPAARLRLELTESLLMKPAALEQLADLKQLGVSISIDHFGTGYSSMQYLKTDQINALIIDKSYTQQYFNNPQALSSTHAMMKLGQTLGKTVVVEGIDSPELASAMKALKCHYLKGTYYSNPLTSLAFESEFPGRPQ